MLYFLLIIIILIGLEILNNQTKEKTSVVIKEQVDKTLMRYNELLVKLKKHLKQGEELLNEHPDYIFEYKDDHPLAIKRLKNNEGLNIIIDIWENQLYDLREKIEECASDSYLLTYHDEGKTLYPKYQECIKVFKEASVVLDPYWDFCEHCNSTFCCYNGDDCTCNGKK